MINNYFKNKKTRGLTVVELIIIIAVLGILFLIVIPQFSKTRENQVLKSAVSDIISSLDKAQSQTMASVNSLSYGVHFQSDEIIIFNGTSYSSNDVNNVTTNIISPASISNVTLDGVSGSSGDVYFNRLSGTPSSVGTITVSTSSFSKIITISATGQSSTN